MDKKFSAPNRDKIVKSLKYHIDRKLPTFRGTTNDLRELVFETSRKVHNENPTADIKMFNKKVLTASFSIAKSMNGRRGRVPVVASPPQPPQQPRPPQQHPSLENQDIPHPQPNFKLENDEPLQDPMKELQKLQTSRNMMDQQFNQSPDELPSSQETNIHSENNTKPNDASSLTQAFLNATENNEETGGLESLFTTILPQDQIKIDNRPSVKSISIQDQTFRKRKTEQLDRDAIAQSKPARNREQEMIIPRTIQQGYYDKEHTLVVYGLDRNWTNMDENRYHFNLKFQSRDSANTIRGQGTAKTDDTFRNIIGMQIVSLILPNENISSMTQILTPGVFDTSKPLNALQYPYINIDIGTFNGEIQGTNQYVNKSFGHMKYDVGIRDRDSNAPDGFLSYIPTDSTQKRIFYPTPLANLKSMNISIRNPIGNILSTDKDCVEVEKIYIANTDISAECPGGPLLADLSNNIPYIDPSIPDTEVGSIGYLIIKTATFFRTGYIHAGDIIQFNDFVVPEDTDSLPAITGTLEQSTKVAFETFINRKEGHHVLDIGYYENVDYDISETGSLVSGGNELGYANYIVIQMDRDDPTSGSIARKLFGSSEAQDYILHQHMSLYEQTGSCLVNTSKQIQIVFKIFTRNYDGSELKPQNI